MFNSTLPPLPVAKFLHPPLLLWISGDKLASWQSYTTVLANVFIILGILSVVVTVWVCLDQRRGARQQWADQWESQPEKNEKLRFALDFLLEPSGMYEGSHLSIPSWAQLLADGSRETRFTFKVDRAWIWIALHPAMSDVFAREFGYLLPLEQYIYSECMYVYLRHLASAEHAMQTGAVSRKRLSEVIRDAYYMLPPFLPVLKVGIRRNQFTLIASLIQRIEKECD